MCTHTHAHMETIQLTTNRPKEFTAPKFDRGESEEEESTVGKLPPNSDDEE